MKSRNYYESLSVQQLVDAARYESREGRPQPELLAVLADMVEGLDDDCALMQTEIDRLMKAGYQEHEAREVALPMFILLPPEPPGQTKRSGNGPKAPN